MNNRSFQLLSPECEIFLGSRGGSGVRGAGRSRGLAVSLCGFLYFLSFFNGIFVAGCCCYFRSVFLLLLGDYQCPFHWAFYVGILFFYGIIRSLISADCLRTLKKYERMEKETKINETPSTSSFH